MKSGRAIYWMIPAIVIPVAAWILLLLFEQSVADVIMNLYPPSVRQGRVFYTDLIFLIRTEILWMGLFLLLALIFAIYPSRDALDHSMVIRSRTKAIYHMMLICSVAFLATVWLAGTILEGFPNSSDEYAYLFQAEMFSRGKLWERAHDLPGFFYINNIPQHDGILVSRFPPGWPLILGSAFTIGLSPALVNPVLGLLTLVVVYRFADRYYGRNVAVWSLLLLALNGYFLFNAASFFSHVSCVLFAVGFVFALYRYGDTRHTAFGLLAGFCLGCVLVIRYYTAVLIFLPFLIYLVVQYRWRVIALFAAMGFGSLPCLAYLFWYNYSITGDPLLPVTVWAYPSEQLGFVKGHTFLKGIEHIVRRALMFLYWASPGLLVLYVVYLWKKVRNSAERLLQPEDYAFAMLVAGYFFYYQIGGNQYGPRFMFEAFPFLVIFVVRKVLESRTKWAMALLLASAFYPLIKLPFITYREAYVVDQRQDLYDLVKERKISNAIVFVAAPTSPVRPMPAEDLTRNDPKFSNDVIYALTLPMINHQIMNYYEDRAVYKYVRELDSPRGDLIRIR